ncbi:MAG: 5-oxoprolinase subunit PxpB [Eubacterium sp.]
MKHSFLQNGDTAITVCFENEISKEVNGFVTSFACAVEQKGIKGVIELIPAFNSVTVLYDSTVTSAGTLKIKLERIIKKLGNSQQSSAVLYKIPVCYEEEFSPDMKNVEAHTGLSREEIIKIHSSTDYLIYMLGFLPGFAYLGEMDKRLATPRLDSPRVEISRGSVGIGGEQTGIYPVASPGGWQLIGRTPVLVYDRERENPILYKSGDYIRFVPISRNEYFEIEKAVQGGTYTVQTEEVRR